MDKMPNIKLGLKCIILEMLGEQATQSKNTAKHIQMSQKDKSNIT